MVDDEGKGGGWPGMICVALIADVGVTMVQFVWAS
jgi:hypothetical protein